jgi:hypothetical protein
MNYVVSVIILLCLITGCHPYYNDAGKSSHVSIPKNFEPIVYDNGLECVEMKHRYHYGLSCNWEKYNKDQENQKENDKNENF